MIRKNTFISDQERAEIMAGLRNYNQFALTNSEITNEDEQYEYLQTLDDNTIFYDILNDNKFVGYLQLKKISWINRTAEISMIISGNNRGQGLGEKYFKLAMSDAFNTLNLHSIHGECYSCNQSKGFWSKMVEKYGGHSAIIPARKYLDGQYYESMFFSFLKNEVKL